MTAVAAAAAPPSIDPMATCIRDATTALAGAALPQPVSFRVISAAVECALRTARVDIAADTYRQATGMHCDNDGKEGAAAAAAPQGNDASVGSSTQHPRALAAFMQQPPRHDVRRRQLECGPTADQRVAGWLIESWTRASALTAVDCHAAWLSRMRPPGTTATLTRACDVPASIFASVMAHGMPPDGEVYVTQTPMPAFASKTVPPPQSAVEAARFVPPVRMHCAYARIMGAVDLALAIATGTTARHMAFDAVRCALDMRFVEGNGVRIGADQSPQQQCDGNPDVWMEAQGIDDRASALRLAACQTIRLRAATCDKLMLTPCMALHAANTSVFRMTGEPEISIIQWCDIGARCELPPLERLVLLGYASEPQILCGTAHARAFCMYAHSLAVAVRMRMFDESAPALNALSPVFAECIAAGLDHGPGLKKTLQLRNPAAARAFMYGDVEDLAINLVSPVGCQSATAASDQAHPFCDLFRIPALYILARAPLDAAQIGRVVTYYGAAIRAIPSAWAEHTFMEPAARAERSDATPCPSIHAFNDFVRGVGDRTGIPVRDVTTRQPLAMSVLPVPDDGVSPPPTTAVGVALAAASARMRWGLDADFPRTSLLRLAEHLMEIGGFAPSMDLDQQD